MWEAISDRVYTEVKRDLHAVYTGCTRVYTHGYSHGEVPRGEKMLYSGTDPELYIREHTLVYEDRFTRGLLFNPVYTGLNRF